MSFFTRYQQYIRNNPQRYWFKRKLYGWGWTPVRWQGWAVVGGYLAAVLYIVSRLAPDASDAVVLKEGTVPIAVLTLLLVVISYVKGESPRWQWGEKKNSEKAD